MSEMVHSDHPIDRPADLKVSSAKLRIRGKAEEEVLPDKIHSWPYFVRVEFIAALIMMAFLIVWSLAIDAPLRNQPILP